MLALARFTTILLIVENPGRVAALHTYTRGILGTLRNHQHLLLKLCRQVHTVKVLAILLLALIRTARAIVGLRSIQEEDLLVGRRVSIRCAGRQVSSIWSLSRG